MNRDQKNEMVSALADIFNKTQVGLLVDYRGLDVADVTDLRGRLHEQAVQMRVLKNRIAKIAIKGTPFESLAENLTDPRALIYGDDPVAPAKVVSKFMADNDKLEFIAGLLLTASGGEVLDLDRIKALGSLPSRDELLAQMMGLLSSVPAGFVRTLNEVPSKFVRTLAALQESKGGG